MGLQSTEIMKQNTWPDKAHTGCNGALVRKKPVVGGVWGHLRG